MKPSAHALRIAICIMVVICAVLCSSCSSLSHNDIMKSYISNNYKVTLNNVFRSQTDAYCLFTFEEVEKTARFEDVRLNTFFIKGDLTDFKNCGYSYGCIGFNEGKNEQYYMLTLGTHEKSLPQSPIVVNIAGTYYRSDISIKEETESQWNFKVTLNKNNTPARFGIKNENGGGGFIDCYDGAVVITPDESFPGDSTDIVFKDKKNNIIKPAINSLKYEQQYFSCVFCIFDDSVDTKSFTACLVGDREFKISEESR